MRRILLILSVSICTATFSQVNFDVAYQANPFVPQGLLEAVAWTNTRMVHLDQSLESCTGMPRAYGIMGLHDNGMNYFVENGKVVQELSGISISDQKASAQTQINAYAKAFNVLMEMRVGSPTQANDPANIRKILFHLSEIPDSGQVNLLARDMQVYEILRFMTSSDKGVEYRFTPFHFDLEAVFGESNYRVLSSQKIKLTKKGIRSEDGTLYINNETKSAQYGPAIWNPAATCNYSSRNGVAISAITIHTVQGTYAGCISWFQNCTASVSAHYVIRSSDGQVTQMVLEEDKAWHVGTENPYTIGYEHEGYVDNPVWYTNEMYVSSADLSKDIVNSGYGIPPYRTYYGPSSAVTQVLGNCTKIKGHQHYVNQTHVDPGIYWNWELYYRLINDNPPITVITSNSTPFYDSGGSTGNYQDDERLLWLFQPSNGQNVTLDFTSFSIESGYDNLFIYDGDTIGAPLIGSYTGTNSPGSVTSTGPSMLVEFRSDCGTVDSGWSANMGTITPDATPPTTSIIPGTLWQTQDFVVNFTDQDNQSGVDEQYYLSAEKDQSMNDWKSNGAAGFAYESFEDNASSWTVVTGTFNYTGSAYEMTDISEQNSNAYMNVTQSSGNTYLFEWDQTITSNQSSQRAGLHFFCSDPTLPNRGDSYFIYLRENDDKAQIYSVTNDVFNLEVDVPLVINAGQTYNCKTTYNPSNGMIELYVDDNFVSSWQDPAPLTSGVAASFRSGGCAVTFDNLHIYKSRSSQVTVTVGSTSEFSTQSELAVESGVVRTVIKDSADNWSTPDTEMYLVDYTAPVFDFINDGNSNDIDTFYTTTFEGNWGTTDIHSGINYFEYAIGTSPGATDVVGWTNNGTTTVMSEVLSSPVSGQVYYLSVRAYNNAGLNSTTDSDGQTYYNDLSVLENYLTEIEIYPNPASENIFVKTTLTGLTYSIFDINGKLCKEGTVAGSINVSNLSNGSYNLILSSGGAFIVKNLIVKH